MMRTSLITSFILHAMVLLAGMIAIPSPDEYKVVKIESVPVDLLSVSEFTRLRAQSKAEKPKKEPEKPKAEEKPKPKPKVAALPPEPEPEPVPVPEPAPKKVEPKPEVKPEPKPEPKPVATPEPKKPEVAAPRPRRKPKPPKTFAAKKKRKKFDPDRIAALLNKIPDQEKPRRKGKPLKRQGAVDLARGDDARVTQDERDALRAQIERCWNPPVGAVDAEGLLVKIRIRLKPDGSLKSAPQVVNSGTSQYFRAAAESAVRAVRRCQPFTMPESKYGSWREIILNFNPREMLRG